MIIDSVKNTKLYLGPGKRIEEAFIWFSKKGKEAEIGEHRIHGNKIFAIVSAYKTKSKNQAQWEAHKKYIDIHFVVNGTEKIGYANIYKLKIISPYNKTKDCTFLAGKGNFFTLNKNNFGIFYPDDAHMPGISLGNIKKVKKVVIKVKV